MTSALPVTHQHPNSDCHLERSAAESKDLRLFLRSLINLLTPELTAEEASRPMAHEPRQQQRPILLKPNAK